MPRKSPRAGPQGQKTKGKGRRHGDAGERRARRSARPRRSWLGRLLVWSLVAAIWLGLAGLGAVAYYAHDLPDVDKIAAETRQPSITVLARDGSVLAARGRVYGETVSLADLPPAVPRAVIAVEDRRFFYHPGVDPLGLARALYVNLRAGEIVQGGSTITQQLAKNLFLTPRRTIKRKVQEVILALWLEWRFTKREILALYLNRVYLGAGAYGVDAAARRYFDKPASRLNVYESAMLAGLLKAPSRDNPVADPAAAHRRATTVLQDMVATGNLTAAQADRIAQGRARGHGAPAWRGRYFADWALSRVRAYVGFHAEDLTVHTTLDRRWQRIAAQALNDTLARKGAARDAGQGAIVLMTPDGAVRALVGGRSYADSQFNRATQARRQPGSAFKPFVYLAALESGLTPASTLVDAPVRVGDWAPQNFADRYYGQVTLREAFARSLNAVAVKLIRRVGPKAVARTARRLGVDSPLSPVPSLALGTDEVSLLELTGAYAVFANGGRGVFPHAIMRITDGTGRTLYERAGEGPGRVVARHQAARMTDLMRANVVWGTGQAADPGRPAAGKTGTSQDFRDAWFLGFTAEIVGGVWVGNDDGVPMDGVTGGTLPAEIWRSAVTRGLKGAPAKPLPGLRDLPAETAPTVAADAEAPAETESPPSVIDRIIGTLTGRSGDSNARAGDDAAAGTDTRGHEQRGR